MTRRSASGSVLQGADQPGPAPESTVISFAAVLVTCWRSVPSGRLMYTSANGLWAVAKLWCWLVDVSHRRPSDPTTPTTG